MLRAFLPATLLVFVSACGNSSSESPGVPSDTGSAGDTATADTNSVVPDVSDPDVSNPDVMADAIGADAAPDTSVADVAPDAPPFTVENVPSRLTAGGGAACAISATGVKQCWGGRRDSIYKAIGTFRAVDAVDTSPGAAIGTPSFCWVATDGSLKCESDPAGGGTGSAPGPYVDVNVGYGGYCAIRTTGELDCSTMGSPLARVGMASDWRRVSVSQSHRLAINASGKLFGWGDNSFGESVPGAGSGNIAEPTTVDSSNSYRDADAAYGVSCAVRSTGELYCWGNPGIIFTKTGTAPMTRIGTDSDWLTVRVTTNHACGLKKTGTIECWGANDYSQLGPSGGMSGFGSYTKPAPVGTDTDWTDVAVDLQFNCGRKASGEVRCWGSNLDGALGFGYNDHKSPTKIGDGYQSVTANGATTCALTTSGALQCWGYTTKLGVGQMRQQTPLTIATTTYRSVTLGDKVPSEVSSLGTYGAAAHFGCARTSDETLLCVGNDVNGETGLGTKGATTAVLSSVGISAKEVALGVDRSCAITTAGGLSCWGLGVTTPTAVGTGTWLHVGVGNKGAFAIAADTSLYTVPPGTSSVSGTGWTAIVSKGDRDALLGIRSGRVYNVSATSIAADTFDGSSDYIAVAAGTVHQCGLRATGQLNCWGTDRYGDLGGGTDVGWDKGWTRNWTSVATGDFHTCGNRNSGELYCWGLNQNGQIGDNTTYRSTPVVVPL